jgi:hypothetical protein
MVMKKGDIFTLETDCETLVYVGIALEDADETGGFSAMQMSVSTSNNKARLSMLTESSFNLNAKDCEVRLLAPVKAVTA